MSDTNLEIKALQELAQKNLEVVQKILGMESINNSDHQLVEQEIIDEQVNTHLPPPLTKFTTSEIAEQKHYLAEQKRYLTAKYANNQAIFAESRQKFLNRPKRIRPSTRTENLSREAW